MISAKWEEGKPYMPWEIQSLDENKIEKCVKSYGREFWLKHHGAFLTRVYPKGTRFDSSNYNPLPGWAVGAQYVALNYQTPDEFFLLNQALFSQNGKSGFLLKSSMMLGLPQLEAKTQTISIEMISGSQIPKKTSAVFHDIVDPYVTMFFWSAADPNNRIQIMQTPVVKNNGLNPVWRVKTQFKITEGEVNLLVIKVQDDDNTLLCWNALPLNCIRAGYRTIEMKSPDLKPLHAASLYCKVSIV